VDGRDLDRLLDQVAALGGGRVFAGSTATWGKQYAIGYVPVYAVLGDRDIDGVGFTLRIASLMTDPEVRFDERNPAQYDLFNIRYLILPADRPPPVRATLLASQGRHRLWQVDTSGYLEVVDASGPPIVADRSSVGRQSAPFLGSSQLPLKHYPTVAFGGTPAAPTTLSPGAAPVDAAGSIQLEVDSPASGVFRGNVVANRLAVVVLKSGYDPRWEATVDGVVVPTEMMAPAVPGVTVAPGRHVVEFRYVPYPHYPLLLAIGLFTLLLLHFGPWLIMKLGARLQSR
jgi:hypothetical protein